jgi:hypothetical protein
MQAAGNARGYHASIMLTLNIFEDLHRVYPHGVVQGAVGDRKGWPGQTGIALVTYTPPGEKVY